MNASPALDHEVVSKDEWLRTHRAFLAEEKELTRRSDDLARRRRELPWTPVEKDYVFDGPHGKVHLGDLFDGPYFGDVDEVTLPNGQVVPFFQPGTENFQGGPACTRYENGQTFILPGCRGPGDPGYDALRDRFLTVYETNLCRATTLFPGMPEVLAALEKRKMPWGVVTNKLERFVHPLLDALQLSARAACVVGGDTTLYSKPHPAPLLAASRPSTASRHHTARESGERRTVERRADPHHEASHSGDRLRRAVRSSGWQRRSQRPASTHAASSPRSGRHRREMSGRDRIPGGRHVRASRS